MQTLIIQNETLEKDIKELRKQLQLMKEQSVKPKNYTRKKSIFGQRTLGRKKKSKATFDAGEKTDGRSVKVLQIITQIHDLILADNVEMANRVVQQNQKKLFPPKTLASPNSRDGHTKLEVSKAKVKSSLTFTFS